MRQIRPRTAHPALATTDPAPLLVDLTDETHAATAEDVLRAQLEVAKLAVREVTQQLVVLIDERDVLRSRLGSVSESPPAPADPDDESIVPWGFCEDEAH